MRAEALKQPAKHTSTPFIVFAQAQDQLIQILILKNRFDVFYQKLISPP